MNTLARVKGENTAIGDHLQAVGLSMANATTAITAPGLAPAALAPAKSVVIVCHLGRAGYNVQRALRAMGVRAYLIYDDRAASARWSRGCKTLHYTPNLATADTDLIVQKINDLHRRVPISSVIATDVSASLLVAEIQHRLEPSVFPLPDPEAVQQLDNKWEFAKLCTEQDVTIPKTLYFAAGEPLDAEQIAATLGYPAIVKPAAGFGQGGITILHTADDIAVLQHNRSAAVVVQEYVIGQDWSLSVFARNGVVTHWTAWECPDQLETNGNAYGVARFLTTRFRNHDGLIAMGRRLIEATGYTGVANFDARRRSADGTMMLLECNPRFFSRMLAARICGLDFLALGLPGHEHRQRTALVDGDHYPWQELFSLRGLKILLSGRWRVQLLAKDIWEMLSDPLPPLMRKLAREEKK